MSLHVVTHAYSGKFLQYSVFLRTHLSSIYLQDPYHEVSVSICYDPSDMPVVAVLKEFQGLLGRRLKTLDMSRGDLFRRAIGRNLAWNLIPADFVWFCDVDHYIGADCVRSLYLQAAAENQKTSEPKPTLYWPGTIRIHESHSEGDAFWKRHVESLGLINPTQGRFSDKFYHKAIGGVQICPAWFLKEHGYLNAHKKWQSPTDGTKPFPNFYDDIAHRNVCGRYGRLVPLNLPNLFRLRHSLVTYKGL